jgi:hypothetical protein
MKNGASCLIFDVELRADNAKGVQIQLRCSPSCGGAAQPEGHCQYSERICERDSFSVHVAGWSPKSTMMKKGSSWK